MDRKNEPEILQRYREGRCTEAERQQLEIWYDDWNRQDRLSLSATELERAERLMRASLWQRLDFEDSDQAATALSKKRVERLWLRIAVGAAAAIAVALGIRLYDYSSAESTPHIKNRSYVNDITPGKNVATLTLSNGEMVALSDKKSAVVINAAELRYDDGTKINNSAESDGEDNKLPLFHTITTPRGGQYQVILSDGTKVWLNAASSIRFPASFAGSRERRIEISGEAYLEVSKDRSHPFIVRSAAQEIGVLGTHFNVIDYADGSPAKTTLLEGSVSVVPLDGTGAERPKTILIPGQQASVVARDIAITATNTAAVTAWKDGNFRFEDESVTAVMKQISRWYNVEIAYQSNVSDLKLNASISRNRQLSQVLEMIEKTGEVHFKIEGRKVIVMK